MNAARESDGATALGGSLHRRWMICFATLSCLVVLLVF